MKKIYETPEVEVVKFQYRDQVVVASGGHECVIKWTDAKGVDNCSGSISKNSQGLD